MRIKIFILFAIMLIVVACSSNIPDRIWFDGKELILISDKKDSDKRGYRVNSSIISQGKSFDLIIDKEPDRYIITYNNNRYILKGNKENYSITYPNKVEVPVSFSRGAIMQSYNEADISEYPSALDYRVFLENSATDIHFDGGQWLFGLIIIFISIISIISPNITWFLNRGWMYKNAEPSELYLSLTKIGGIIGCIIGIILILSSCAAA